MESKRIRTLKVQFSNEISLTEIPFFRGAIIRATEGKSLLFHNHIGDKLRYSYPLIQYKRIGGKAALFCIGDGTDSIGDFFSSGKFDVEIGNRKTRLEVCDVRPQNTMVQLWQSNFKYSIRKYLPLNQENYKAYMEMESMVEKCQLIERCLTGNILMFAKSQDIMFEDKVVVNIVSIETPRTLKYKGVRMMAFDAVFSTNVSLPDYIGLGKGESLGFGVVTRIKDKKQ